MWLGRRSVRWGNGRPRPTMQTASHRDSAPPRPWWRLECTPVPPTQRVGGWPQSTARLWQDLERALSARRRAVRAVKRARKRRARWPRLARRLGAGGSRAAQFLRRKRSWRTTPSKSSATLCCSVADVSMNLQSNTTAQARPSEGAGSGEPGRSHNRKKEIKVAGGVFNLNRKHDFSFPHTSCCVPGDSERNLALRS